MNVDISTHIQLSLNNRRRRCTGIKLIPVTSSHVVVVLFHLVNKVGSFIRCIIIGMVKCSRLGMIRHAMDPRKTCNSVSMEPRLT
jgi:hypothetical protein